MAAALISSSAAPMELFKAKRKNPLPPKEKLHQVFYELLAQHHGKIQAMDPSRPETQFKMKQFMMMQSEATACMESLKKGEEYEQPAREKSSLN